MEDCLLIIANNGKLEKKVHQKLESIIVYIIVQEARKNINRKIKTP